MVVRPVNIKEILEDHKNIEILKLLQRNPRMSIAELARKIKMSNPATKERVRRLEKSGVIAGYRLELDPKSAGQIASFSRFIYPKSHLWIASWIGFSFTGRPQPPSCSPRPYRRGDHPL